MFSKKWDQFSFYISNSWTMYIVYTGTIMTIYFEKATAFSKPTDLDLTDLNFLLILSYFSSKMKGEFVTKLTKTNHLTQTGNLSGYYSLSNLLFQNILLQKNTQAISNFAFQSS